MRGLPTILHEHANLTDTPWFQKVADRLLEPYTDIAIAVSESTADFVRDGAAGPARAGEGRLPRRAARGVQPRRGRRGDRGRARRSSASRPASSRSAPSRGCTTRRATATSWTRPRRSSRERPAGAVLPGGRRTAPPGARGAGAARSASAIGSCSSGFVKDVAAALSALRPERVPVALGRHAAHRLRGAGDGQADRRDRRRRAARHPARRRDGADRAEARCRRARRARSSGCIDHPDERARLRGRGRGSRRGSSTSTRSSGRWSGSTRCSTRCRGRRSAAASCSRTSRFSTGGAERVMPPVGGQPAALRRARRT